MESLSENMENFRTMGPTGIKKQDWNNSDHRRIALACLVQSVYILQADKERGRTKNQTFAQDWWQCFNYRLAELIMNDKRTHINGAVFKWKGCQYWKPKRAPMIVVAFRGTFLRSEATSSDLEVDYRIVSHRLHKAARFETALGVVTRLAETYHPKNVCVVGHSLGAAIGLLVARKLAEDGSLLEAHLFNPPFASIPLETLAGSTVALGVNMMYTLATAGLALLLQNFEHGKQVMAAFTAVQSWVPDMYVNVKDAICSGYLEYFSVRKMIASQKTLVSLTAPFSFRGIIHFMHGMDSKPYHLIPSARLHVSSRKSDGYLASHSLSRWWSPEAELETIYATIDSQELVKK
ncbi:hypothetical protein O6H91_06G138800 [Diphasiastrum complanatum]|uniref:Uncharacterized protein n=1 Tax=Diphasiastrum complanatum TaxID=34168 RepID=A0ACC2DJT3_DIPCM|nr:hypothetical protein O6H91_Y108100 [Diphasiastrum complanatum]KAJ7554408.1 hypothetical protein O6H91_06G138800 [Diphasiastrum complanatum]